jgi:mRNA interferase MazF
VDFGPPTGSAAGYRRPAVVVQSDGFNASRIGTVLVAPTTGTLRLADAPGNVLLTKNRSGLPRDSVVNVSLTSAIDRSCLSDFIGVVDDETMKRIDRGLRDVLGL